MSSQDQQRQQDDRASRSKAEHSQRSRGDRTDRSRGEARKQARAFAIIVYHALRSDLANLDEGDDADRLDEERARRMILRAVNLFPGYQAEADAEHGHSILIEKTGPEPETVVLNIQDAVDSLQIVWRDFRRLSGRDAAPDDAIPMRS